uniref:Uncharacterized protein n=1 Tax=Arion vulgaris TaxID=1028688 RepID=A0A0B7AYX7_9EUPU
MLHFFSKRRQCAHHFCLRSAPSSQICHCKLDGPVVWVQDSCFTLTLVITQSPKSTEVAQKSAVTWSHTMSPVEIKTLVLIVTKIVL